MPRSVWFQGRRSVIFGALAAIVGLTAAANDVQAQAAKPLKVRLTVQPASLVTTLIEVAAARKFFDKVGVDAETITVAHGPAAVTALASGSVDIATNAPEVFLALAGKGQSLKLIAGQARQIGIFVTRPGLELPSEFPASVQALKGKKIGVTALSSATQYLSIAMLNAAGLATGDVSFVAVGAGAPAALSNGVVDVAYVNGQQVVVSQALGARTLIDLRSADKCPPQLNICGIGQIGMWAMGDWITKNPDAVARVRKAVAMADRFLHDPANAAAARALLLKHLPADAGEKLKDDYVAYALSVLTAAFSRSDLERWIEIDHKASVIAAPFPVANVFADGTPETALAVEALAR